jgi:hypothetical protein
VLSDRSGVDSVIAVLSLSSMLITNSVALSPDSLGVCKPEEEERLSSSSSLICDCCFICEVSIPTLIGEYGLGSRTSPVCGLVGEAMGLEGKSEREANASVSEKRLLSD